MDPKFQRPGASRLAAALEGLASSGSDGHLIARSASGRPNFGGAAGAAAAAAAADAVRLVASAKRVSKPAADLVGGTIGLIDPVGIERVYSACEDT